LLGQLQSATLESLAVEFIRDIAATETAQREAEAAQRVAAEAKRLAAKRKKATVAKDFLSAITARGNIKDTLPGIIDDYLFELAEFDKGFRGVFRGASDGGLNAEFLKTHPEALQHFIDGRFLVEVAKLDNRYITPERRARIKTAVDSFMTLFAPELVPVLTKIISNIEDLQQFKILKERIRNLNAL
jgi:hypothetical protein